MPNDLLPNDPEAEKCLLGSILLDATTLPALAFVRPEMFFSARNAQLFSAIADMLAAGTPVDAITLRDHLAAAGLLDRCGGSEFLVDLVNAVPTAANAEYYGRIVQRKAVLRAYALLGARIQRLASEPAAEPDDVAAEVDKALAEIARAGADRVAEKFAEIAKAVYARLLSPDQTSPGIRTGLFPLDSATGGLHKGELTVIGARPSIGKSSFSIRIAETVGQCGAGAVLIFSLEVGGAQMVQNFICSVARLNTHKARTGKFTEADKGQLLGSAEIVSRIAIWVDDDPDVTVAEIRARARRFALTEKLALVVVDYLQLVRTGRERFDSREAEVSAISRNLKAMARELDVPVLALSQLNRGVEHRAEHVPMLADLRESGSLEQDADMVLLLNRPGVYEDSEEDESVAHVYVAKQRHGPVGRIELKFQKECIRFDNPTFEGDGRDRS